MLRVHRICLCWKQIPAPAQTLSPGPAPSSFTHLTRTLVSLIALLALFSSTGTAAPLGTAFTYQGKLTSGGNPSTGFYDLKFSLFDALAGGSQVGASLTNAVTGVTNGLFTVTLDFGAVFAGNASWLEIGVRSNGVAVDFTTLSPRQCLTPAPYALYAPSAGAAATATTAASANAVAAANVTGTLLDATLSTNVALRNTTNMFTATNVFTAPVGIDCKNPGRVLQVGNANTFGSQGIIRLASRSTNSAENRVWDIGVPQTGTNLSGAGYSFVIDDTQLGTRPGVHRPLGQWPRRHWSDQSGERLGCQWNCDCHRVRRQRRRSDKPERRQPYRHAAQFGLFNAFRYDCGFDAGQRSLACDQRLSFHDDRARARYGQRFRLDRAFSPLGAYSDLGQSATDRLGR